MNILDVRNLQASVEDKLILKGVNLKINAGEVHMIMGPNGSGKSTLSNVLMGHPAYKVNAGEVSFCGENLFDMTVDERSRKGLFLSFQYPEEITGITNEYFIRKAYSQKIGSASVPISFRKELREKIKDLHLDPNYLERHLNVGFSGGEKKKNEILQMKVLDPKLAILDETDSGLDVDAIKVVYETVQQNMRDDNSVLIITHYSRILKYIKPDFIHLFVDGKIIKSGDISLANEIDEKGYKGII